MNELDIKIRIIRKLVRWRKWGESHTENILGGLPSHMSGGKIVRDVLKELIKEGWLLPAKKTGEIHYSLNPDKIEEITKFYDEYCKEN